MLRGGCQYCLGIELSDGWWDSGECRRKEVRDIAPAVGAEHPANSTVSF